MNERLQRLVATLPESDGQSVIVERVTGAPETPNVHTVGLKYERLALHGSPTVTAVRERNLEVLRSTRLGSGVTYWTATVVGEGQQPLTTGLLRAQHKVPGVLGVLRRLLNPSAGQLELEVVTGGRYPHKENVARALAYAALTDAHRDLPASLSVPEGVDLDLSEPMPQPAEYLRAVLDDPQHPWLGVAHTENVGDVRLSAAVNTMPQIT